MISLSLANLGLALLAGSLTTLSPCVLPLLPLVLGGVMQHNRLAPLAMGLGMAASFALIGILIGGAGAGLDLDGDQVRLAGAWILLLFGAAMLVPGLGLRLAGWLQPLSAGANTLADRVEGRGLGGAFLLGGLLGMVWSPCSGPILGSILTLVASQGGAIAGGIMLGVFGLGAALPLMTLGYVSRSTMGRIRAAFLSHAGKIKFVFGLLIAATGLAIITGGDKWFEAAVVSLLPDAWVALTTHF